MRRAAALAGAALALVVAPPAAQAADTLVRSGPLNAHVRTAPFALDLVDGRGRPVLPGVGLRLGRRPPAAPRGP